MLYNVLFWVHSIFYCIRLIIRARETSCLAIRHYYWWFISNMPCPISQGVWSTNQRNDNDSDRIHYNRNEFVLFLCLLDATHRRSACAIIFYRFAHILTANRDSFFSAQFLRKNILMECRLQPNSTYILCCDKNMCWINMNLNEIQYYIVSKRNESNCAHRRLLSLFRSCSEHWRTGIYWCFVRVPTCIFK